MARGRGREWWLERVVEQAASGLSVAEFCRRRKLSSPRFYGWLRKLAAEPAVVTESDSLEGLEPRQLPFMPLELVERPCRGIRSHLASGAVLELPAERECLRLVLSVLSELETA
ncbi:MAG: IS66 family insertion sequence element accessory protein TnpA [Planctomycetota bacterium]